jgi:hypothetical protein
VTTPIGRSTVRPPPDLTFSDFAEAMGFVNRVALVAEKADHHPTSTCGGTG